jgi:anaerobic magnesium-protoporphyrin IX monomethyl ester cyclase
MRSMKEAQNSLKGKSYKKVLLIYPKTGLDIPGISVFMPLSVLFLAAALEEAGFEAVTIDMRTDAGWKKTLLSGINSGVLFIGISAMTGKQIELGIKAAKLIRKADPDIPIVWGGIHSSVLPKETLESPWVDAVVAGPGEKVVVNLARRLSSGDRSVLGVVHRHDPQGRAAQVGHQLNLEKIPWKTYETPIVRDVRGLVHVTSRGCPHQCGYCYNKAVNGSRWISDSAELVLEALERMASVGIQGLIFFDDNFFVSQKRVEKIARGILNRNLKFAIKADCRADYIMRYDRDFLKLIKKAGFELLYIGAESGSNQMLEMMNKGIDIACLLQVNQRLKKTGIRPHYSFMAGLPGETIRMMQDTLRFMLRLKEEHPGAYLSPVKAYMPYPGTDMFRSAVELGFQAPASLEEWGRVDWYTRPGLWLSKAEAKFVEKMIYVTLGVDPSVNELSGIKQRKVASWGFLKFSKLCKSRINKPDLGLIPELPFFRLARRVFSS